MKKAEMIKFYKERFPARNAGGGGCFLHSKMMRRAISKLI